MQSSGSTVVCRAVSKGFGDRTVTIGQLDLEAGPGELVSIIGPSGCGKSTLLRLIAGLIPPTSGQILVDGRSPEPGCAGISFIFQEPTLLPWLTVRGNVEMPLRVRRDPWQRRQERVRDLIKLVGLEHATDFYPRHLSGGMKMRVSVARALGTSPRLLLLDEPFGALDEMTRQQLNEDLLRLRNRENWTAMFVTHSVAEAVFLSTRVLIMAPNPGRIFADMPVDLPAERSAETRESSGYLDLVRRVAHTLRSVEVDAP